MEPSIPCTLFLAGDVMLGRGVDQVLPHSCPPLLHEPWVKSALEYVELAEAVHGPIPAPVGFDWVWGALLDVLRRRDPHARIVNLETAVTTRDEPAAKGIHYRTHPGNVPVLTEAGIDVCVLANNHVLDWGRAGLLETLDTLEFAGIAVAGAGRDADEAGEPAVLPIPGAGRILVVGVGGPDCGVPPEWAAGAGRPGVNYLRDYSEESAEAVARSIERRRSPGDLVVASVHWGPNWGYDIPRKHRRFAHALIDRAGVHVVHGHSSHHPIAAEVYSGRLILYGCGDLITDYEGIGGYEEFRADLALAYFPTLQAQDGRLLALELEPFQVRNFRLVRPSDEDRAWLVDRLAREYGRFGLHVEAGESGALRMMWE